MSVIDIKDTILYIKDGGSENVSSPTVKQLEIIVGEGNFQFTDRQSMVYRKNGGNLDTVALGDQEPIDVTFDVNWEYLKGESGSPSIREALDNTGFASAWVSTDSDVCAPYAADIMIERVRDCGGDVLIELTFFKQFRFEERSSDLRGATLQISGKCMSMYTIRVDTPSALEINGDTDPDVSGSGSLYSYDRYITFTDSLLDLRTVYLDSANKGYGIGKAASETTGYHYFIMFSEYPDIAPDGWKTYTPKGGWTDSSPQLYGSFGGSYLGEVNSTLWT